MPISLRAAALRTALERAVDAPARLLAVEHGMRVYATAPDPSDTAAWERAMSALRSADRWGSTTASGVPEIWAEVHDEVSP
ncbi:hypothetical protein [Streptomyces sp. bgisy154]|uniref:hypothetical protein n=1 Tax=Streptomyces sp. bgisy154 TaxID=3413794 RepID=UPI003D75BB3D